LTLGIVHEGVAFPLLWWMLEKKGNSNTKERVDLLSDTLIDDYAQRWGIETLTLFVIFKSRGFNLEDTHLVDSERLSRLFALLTIALCWACRTGKWLHEQKTNQN
jgi:hypothetical protein